MGIRLSNVLTNNDKMIHISLEIKRQVEARILRIKKMEIDLMHSKNLDSDSMEFYKMMDETQNLLDTTMPTKKTYNTNKNQNLY